jgi:hypothetical protein
LFEHVARRWSLVLGVNITPAQAMLCLVDLKVARLTQIQGTSTASSTSEATPAAWRSFCPMREFRSHLSRQGAKSIDAEAEKPLGWREHGILHASPEGGA